MKNELNTYSFQDFREEISEGRNELMFRYNNIVYSIGIHGSNTLNLKSALKMLFKRNHSIPLWEFVNETSGVTLLIDKNETIIDKILINEKKLEEIWEFIEII